MDEEALKKAIDVLLAGIHGAATPDSVLKITQAILNLRIAAVTK